MNADILKPGHFRLTKLRQEGRLCEGDSLETYTLGACIVERIESTHTITVKRETDGKYYRLTGLLIPGARLAKPAIDSEVL